MAKFLDKFLAPFSWEPDDVLSDDVYEVQFNPVLCRHRYRESGVVAPWHDGTPKLSQPAERSPPPLTGSGVKPPPRDQIIDRVLAGLDRAAEAEGGGLRQRESLLIKPMPKGGYVVQAYLYERHLSFRALFAGSLVDSLEFVRKEMLKSHAE